MINTSLSPSEFQRYARHLSLPEFGKQGQQALKASKVLCIGAGGLGSPIAMYLAAAGVGKIGLVDPDVVDISNLQRQLLHGTKDVGRKKVESAKERLRDLNPEIEIEIHDLLFKNDIAYDLAKPYDLIIDGTDNLPSRYLSNDVCVLLKKPNVYGSIFRFTGQSSVFAPHLGGPCYRCMFPVPPKPGNMPSCAEGGVLGVLPGIIGMIQSIEAIKLLTGIGTPLVGRILKFDALQMKFQEFKLKRNPNCPICSDNPTITNLVDYNAFCGLPSVTEQSKTTKNEITVEDYKVIQDSGITHILLDVRENYELEIASLDKSIHISLKELPSRQLELPIDEHIYVICKSGDRSARATEILRDSGYSVTNIAGGINAWSKYINPDIVHY